MDGQPDGQLLMPGRTRHSRTTIAQRRIARRPLPQRSERRSRRSLPCRLASRYDPEWWGQRQRRQPCARSAVDASSRLVFVRPDRRKGAEGGPSRRLDRAPPPWSAPEPLGRERRTRACWSRKPLGPASPFEYAGPSPCTARPARSRPGRIPTRRPAVRIPHPGPTGRSCSSATDPPAVLKVRLGSRSTSWLRPPVAVLSPVPRRRR